MKVPYFIIVIAALISALLYAGCSDHPESTELELRSPFWQFPDTPATSVLFPETPSAVFDTPSDSSSFTVKLWVDLLHKDSTRQLLNIPGVLEVRTYLHDANNRKLQNYPGYPLADGSVPVLEAALRLHPPGESDSGRDMVAGIPLGILAQPEGKYEIILHFSGVRWSLYVDNQLMDNDFALGYPRWPAEGTWNLNSPAITKAALFLPGIEPYQEAPTNQRVTQDIQYWTPPGHNTWVGDVATFYHQGRYHVFYLFDRRGHASKFGRGAHYFEHISTTDFKTWTEHEAATPIEQQWETFGTGTPFLFDGKLSISYGLHTTRIYPSEQTTLPMQWDYYHKHGYTGSFRYDTLSAYPAGSTYSVSEDGVSRFRKTNILFHPSENPSIYTDPQGRLRMLANYGAKGTWESSTVNGGWSAINPEFPPGGDCTFYFRWKNFDYIIGGFTGCWSKTAEAPDDGYVDMVPEGLDFYNGMCVPAVTEIHDGRFLLAGWIPIAGWGGTLNIHEMIQDASGRIGVKWMDEILPAVGESRSLAKLVRESTSFESKTSSFLLSFDVYPQAGSSGKLGVLFEGENGEESGYEFQISPSERRAQYANGKRSQFAEPEKTLREGGAPHRARNYAIENLTGVDQPFTVRLIVKYERKFGGSQIDAEIAGARTMISFRPGLKTETLYFKTDQTEIRNLKIAPLQHQD